MNIIKTKMFLRITTLFLYLFRNVHYINVLCNIVKRDFYFALYVIKTVVLKNFPFTKFSRGVIIFSGDIREVFMVGFRTGVFHTRVFARTIIISESFRRS